MNHFLVVVEVPLNPDAIGEQDDDSLYTFAAELLEKTPFVEVVQKLRPTEHKQHSFEELARHVFVVARKSLQERREVEAVIAVTFINFAPFNTLDDCEQTLVILGAADKHGPIGLGRAHAELPQEREAFLRENFERVKRSLMPEKRLPFDQRVSVLIVQLIKGYETLERLAEEAHQKARQAKAN